MAACGCGAPCVGSRRFGEGAGSSKHGQRYMPTARAARFSVLIQGSCGAHHADRRREVVLDGVAQHPKR